MSSRKFTVEVGSKFGQWQVVSEPHAVGSFRYASVRCSCGHEDTVRLLELVHGRSSQCRTCASRAGHQARRLQLVEQGGSKSVSVNKPSIIINPGDVFGKLTVVGLSTTTRYRAFECRCECGNIKVEVPGRLTSGYTTHCAECGRNARVERNTQLNAQKQLEAEKMEQLSLLKPQMTVLEAIEQGHQTRRAIQRATERGVEEVGNALANLWDEEKIYSQVIKGERHWFRKSVHVVKEGPVSSLATVAAAGFFHGADCRRVA